MNCCAAHSTLVGRGKSRWKCQRRSQQEGLLLAETSNYFQKQTSTLTMQLFPCAAFPKWGGGGGGEVKYVEQSVIWEKKNEYKKLRNFKLFMLDADAA